MAHLVARKLGATRLAAALDIQNVAENVAKVTSWSKVATRAQQGPFCLPQLEIRTIDSLPTQVYHLIHRQMLCFGAAREMAIFLGVTSKLSGWAAGIRTPTF